MDLGLRADVDALRGLIENQDPRLGREPARQGNLLLVAAGQTASGRLRAGALDREVAHEVFRQRLLGGGTQPCAGKQFPVHRHGHVFRNGHLEHDAVASAILRHVGDTVVYGVLRRK